MSTSDLPRRQFVASTLGGATLAALSSSLPAQEVAGRGLPTRVLGRTGVRISAIGLGGHSIGTVKDESEAIKIMHAAIDEGLTFFDNAWEYHDGRSETLQGKALATNGRRKKVFLMTKNCGRDASETRKCLEESLRRLQTDYLDLWMFHEINYDNDPQWIMEKGGLAEALKAQKAGTVRFLGFTGHKSPHIHLKMLEIHNWDAVLMPINVCDPHYRSFIREVLPKANQRGIGTLGMKSLGGGQNQKGRFVVEKLCSAQEARRFSLSQPIASLICGIDSMEILKQDVAIARDFMPMTLEEQEKLLARVKPYASDGSNASNRPSSSIASTTANSTASRKPMWLARSSAKEGRQRQDPPSPGEYGLRRTELLFKRLRLRRQPVEASADGQGSYAESWGSAPGAATSGPSLRWPREGIATSSSGQTGELDGAGGPSRAFHDNGSHTRRTWRR